MESVRAWRPAAEVAAVVGFHDQPHMIRHFRRHLGVTPSHWARGPAAPHDLARRPTVAKGEL